MQEKFLKLAKKIFKNLLTNQFKYGIINTERERKIPNTRKVKTMTKFRFTYKNLENAFAAMLKNSNYNTWYELFDSENFEAEFAKFIGTTEDELWKHKAFVQWYNETAEEL